MKHDGMIVSRSILKIIFGAAVCLPAAAFAQEGEAEYSYFGLGLRVRPAYEGADSHRSQAIPYVRYYGKHLFARTTQGMLEGGIRLKPIGKLVLGAQLTYEDGRVADESAFLKEHNLEDINPGASAGVHAEIDWNIGPMPWNGLVRYRRNLDSDLGAQADFRVTAGIFSRGRVRAGLYGQLTWSDDKATQSYFGLSAQQASATGLPAYSAGAGLRFFQLGLLGETEISGRWIALWGVNAHWLEGDARNSPIVQDRTNWYANAGVAYRF